MVVGYRTRNTTIYFASSLIANMCIPLKKKWLNHANSKGPMQREKLFDDMRHRCNYVHNIAVMKSGKGELVPYR